MLGRVCRPSGNLGWILSKIGDLGPWSVLGCLSTEDRSLALWEWLVRNAKKRTHSEFILVKSEPSRFSDKIDQLLAARKLELNQLGRPDGNVNEVPLFSSDEAIVNRVDQFIERAHPNVILDVTSMPKRFFFPFIHRILRSARIQNLLATYTSPQRYHDGVLAEDHKALAPLPLFRTQTVAAPKVDLVIIGVGFMPLGLPDFLEKHKHQVDVRTLFPFPPGPPAFQRNWRFINALRKDYPEAVKDPVRVDARDVSDAFDYIKVLTENGRLRCEFGPFGPKPISLAMCLFARLTASVVRYTQPTVYHPEYTTGVQKGNDGEPAINTYVIRIGGRDLYSV
jgi:hypothetical protein